MSMLAVQAMSKAHRRTSSVDVESIFGLCWAVGPQTAAIDVFNVTRETDPWTEPLADSKQAVWISFELWEDSDNIGPWIEAFKTYLPSHVARLHLAFFFMDPGGMPGQAYRAVAPEKFFRLCQVLKPIAANIQTFCVDFPFSTRLDEVSAYFDYCLNLLDGVVGLKNLAVTGLMVRASELQMSQLASLIEKNTILVRLMLRGLCPRLAQDRLAAQEVTVRLPLPESLMHLTIANVRFSLTVPAGYLPDLKTLRLVGKPGHGLDYDLLSELPPSLTRLETDFLTIPMIRGLHDNTTLKSLVVLSSWGTPHVHAPGVAAPSTESLPELNRDLATELARMLRYNVSLSSMVIRRPVDVESIRDISRNNKSRRPPLTILKIPTEDSLKERAFKDPEADAETCAQSIRSSIIIAATVLFGWLPYLFIFPMLISSVVIIAVAKALKWMMGLVFDRGTTRCCGKEVHTDDVFDCCFFTINADLSLAVQVLMPCARRTREATMAQRTISSGITPDAKGVEILPEKPKARPSHRRCFWLDQPSWAWVLWALLSSFWLLLPPLTSLYNTQTVSQSGPSYDPVAFYYLLAGIALLMALLMAWKDEHLTEVAAPVSKITYFSFSNVLAITSIFVDMIQISSICFPVTDPRLRQSDTYFNKVKNYISGLQIVQLTPISNLAICLAVALLWCSLAATVQFARLRLWPAFWKRIPEIDNIVLFLSNTVFFTVTAGLLDWTSCGDPQYYMFTNTTDPIQYDAQQDYIENYGFNDAVTVFLRDGIYYPCWFSPQQYLAPVAMLVVAMYVFSANTVGVFFIEGLLATKQVKITAAYTVTERFLKTLIIVLNVFWGVAQKDDEVVLFKEIGVCILLIIAMVLVVKTQPCRNIVFINHLKLLSFAVPLWAVFINIIMHIKESYDNNDEEDSTNYQIAVVIGWLLMLPLLFIIHRTRNFLPMSSFAVTKSRRLHRGSSNTGSNRRLDVEDTEETASKAGPSSDDASSSASKQRRSQGAKSEAGTTETGSSNSADHKQLEHLAALPQDLTTSFRAPELAPPIDFTSFRPPDLSGDSTKKKDQDVAMLSDIYAAPV